MVENYDDLSSDWARFGTGSQPEVPQGWHCDNRFEVSHNPRHAPHS